MVGPLRIEVLKEDETIEKTLDLDYLTDETNLIEFVDGEKFIEIDVLVGSSKHSTVIQEIRKGREGVKVEGFFYTRASYLEFLGIYKEGKELKLYLEKGTFKKMFICFMGEPEEICGTVHCNIFFKEV